VSGVNTPLSSKQKIFNKKNKENGMAILVTGCAGFIGSHFCEKLLSNNHEVIGLDNLNPYYNPKFKQQNLKILELDDNFTFIKGDIQNQTLLKLLFSNYSIENVVHLGAIAGVRTSINIPLEYSKNNILGTLNLLEVANKFGVSSFNFASSSSVYGNSTPIPFKENAKADLPESPYAATKRSVELFGYTYHSLYGLNFHSFRFFTVYGPRGRPDMAVYKFTKNILEGNEIYIFGNGLIERDYTYVTDIIDGLFSGLNKKLGFEIFNLGSEQSISVNELVNKIEQILNKKARRKYIPQYKGDVKKTFADISKAKNILGYEPKVDINSGLKKFIKWYKSTYC